MKITVTLCRIVCTKCGAEAVGTRGHVGRRHRACPGNEKTVERAALRVVRRKDSPPEIVLATIKVRARSRARSRANAGTWRAA